ncbi:hypothetical protein KDW36_07885 [Burkholderia dolosa]|uniref:hypothetical protein n=1 Tax=Burkholderia dolosa TaxID=152500 RepID=UPI001B913C58|nr:hypothetical protein [Burkholderia dolosa]MBR8313118.1 hypothetical protein [Burkholderia dolosa]
MSSVTTNRMSIHLEDGRKIAEFFAQVNTKTVHKSDIKAFAGELKKVSNGLAKLADKKLSFMSRNAVHADVAKRFERCASMSSEIESKLAATTYQHNPKKLKDFSAAQSKLSNLMRKFGDMNEQDAFRAHQAKRQEQSRVIDAEMKAARREELKKNPDANFNGGMVR